MYKQIMLLNFDVRNREVLRNNEDPKLNPSS